jgi:hypothetical protein
MPPKRHVLLVIAVPVAVLAYGATAGLLGMLDLPDGLRGLVLLFVPLLVGGLCAIPFIAPTFDHLAKQALADRPSTQPRADEDRPARKR